MSLETSLWTSVSGLFAAQRQLEVASHNIANVNTPGYSRQRVELEPSRPQPGVTGSGGGVVGTGVTIKDIIRLRNGLTDSAYWTESGNSGATQVRSDVLQRAESILGPVGSGVPEGLSKFWTAWDNLSLNGNDTAARQGVLDAGNELASQIRGASAQLQRLTSDTTQNVSETVDNVNRLAAQAAKLNQAIKESMVSGHTPNDLMDQRDQVIDQLTNLTGGTVQAGDFGTQNVYVSNRPLVFGSDSETMQASTSGAVTWTIDGKSVAGGGRLGGLQELVNTTLPSIGADLDNFANGLRDVINTAHLAGVDQDGNPAQAFFTGTGAHDLAVNASLTTRNVAAATTNNASDASNALNIAGLRTAAAVGSSTLGQSIQALAGRLGGMSASAQASAGASKDMLDSISTQRAQDSSVSTDEELADIVQFQHAYQASAKVIQVVDSCLDTLVNLVRS
ncbi:MAG TPA: flagellar hook-associated protein FlgK [Acidimicrobiales bacterium]|nr:flagellar hook-associated protein FlgK [Acidimicrobiales bacterium]